MVGGRAGSGSLRCAVVGLRSGGTCQSRTLIYYVILSSFLIQGAHTCLHLLNSGTTPSILSIRHVITQNNIRLSVEQSCTFSLFCIRLLDVSL